MSFETENAIHVGTSALPRLKTYSPQNRLDDRGIRARPADAHFFQRLGERGFA